MTKDIQFRQLWAQCEEVLSWHEQGVTWGSRDERDIAILGLMTGEDYVGNKGSRIGLKLSTQEQRRAYACARVDLSLLELSAG